MRIPLCIGLAAVAVFSCLTPAAAEDWSGCYGGVGLAMVRAESTATDLPFREGPYAGLGVGWNTAYESTNPHGSRAAATFFLGCDRPIAATGNGALVLGAIADLSVLNVKGEAAFSGTGRDTVAAFDIKYAASLRARLGYGQDRTLFYVTGGLARADLDVSASDHSPPAMMTVSGGGSQSGWVVGAGVEWMLAKNRSLDVSLLHYDFGTLTATGKAISPADAVPRFEQKVTADTLRVGMILRF